MGSLAALMLTIEAVALSAVAAEETDGLVGSEALVAGSEAGARTAARLVEGGRGKDRRIDAYEAVEKTFEGWGGGFP